MKDMRISRLTFQLRGDHSRLSHVYRFKEDVNDRFGLTWGVGYSKGDAAQMRRFIVSRLRRT